jgi:ABC-type multidrug transport system fused ATPase/permease subunit
MLAQPGSIEGGAGVAQPNEVPRVEGRPKRRLGRIAGTVLTVLAVLCFALAVPAAWAKRTLLDTDRYVATVAPLAQDPAVQEYLARTVTQQVFAALEVETRLADVLQERDPRLAFLAGPISTGVESFVQGQLRAIFASEAFAGAWEQANRFVHSQLLVVLEGSSESFGGQAVQVQNGAIVLNLLPLVNQGLQAMTGLVTDLVGHAITLPQISAEEIPSEAITRLESALGINLPDQFGTVTVYNTNDLEAVQKAVDLASRLIVLVVILFLVFAALALWVSPRKRRTLLQLATAAAVVLVVERRFAIAEGNTIVAGAKVENQAATRAVVDQVLGSLLRYTGWLLLVAVLTLLVALLTGPYPWAVGIRRFVADLGRTIGGAARERQTSGAVVWTSSHRDALMLAGAFVGVVVLFLADVSVAVFFVLALLIAVYELVIYRVAAVQRVVAVPETEPPPEGS